ncbi:hypothetical protein MMC07_001035 [Pseudocyphellaria aurata]|nr:hypothetical protein [Pseudocyphellaria aurata]
MSKRTIFTTLTSLPTGITREIVLESLHNHVEMIDLNPLVEERHPIKAPAKATPEEFHCIWYSLTDKIQYLPGGLYSGKVTYSACFHDLSNGLQTHCYAPMGLDIKGKWTVGGTLPHEPVEPVEMGLGAPKRGLWLREDVDMKCNILMTSFVKKTLKKAHATLVERLVEKSHLLEAEAHNSRIWETNSNYSYHSSRTDNTRFQAPLGSPDPSNNSRFSGSTASPGFSGPSRLSPDPEGRDRKSYNSYPSAWSSPSLQQVDPAYQAANPYAPDAKHQSFQSHDARHPAYQGGDPTTEPYRTGDPRQQPGYTGDFKPQTFELPSQDVRYAELDASDPSLKPAPLRTR